MLTTRVGEVDLVTQTPKGEPAGEVHQAIDTGPVAMAPMGNQILCRELGAHG
ncbi:hypothetical protein WL1483_297 [Aeromonas schubertii]|uniref:Uncharacterized protein n=1 Tax=Aeromonas schubertii TaxID=652 RepID=A0A0S2SDG1_9GAMM|nr:hypothetical protein WL1483_297 [Aeromonas schubertii]